MINVLIEFGIFLKKQASSAIFGGLMLFFLLLSRVVAVPGFHRYDVLFVVAVLVQLVLIVTRLEHPKEILAIIIFHICAMLMEIWKTSPAVGSWSYPEPAFFAIATVPLFTGFMYSSVGSYIARSWRINNFRFVNLPKRLILILLGLTIYVNFFTNVLVQDARYLLFALAVVIFWKTKFYATITSRTFCIHPLVSNALFAGVIWLAEQAGTFSRAWIYADQSDVWTPVSFHYFTSWYMLLIFSFIIISLIYKNDEEIKSN
ncbi:MAG: DUF817 family protein [Candidatus Pacebacteria bacterium]|nr:DUF817 family protein [Candidatus Paceibacterota bacterium]